MKISSTCALLCLLAASPALAQTPHTASEGILLLAHGGQPDWNDRVQALATEVNQTQPVEVAFGMASRPSIQSAIDRLLARGVSSIVAVPLFISSHSSVVTSTAYLLGVRAEMPADLKTFAGMNHGGRGAAHEGHSMPVETVADNTRRVDSTVPIRMAGALDRHRIVGEILTDRAKGISQSPAQEAVILVAHGPVPDDDNTRWLSDMSVLADQIIAAAPFAAIDYLTVRDDAPKAVRDTATAELRAMVQSHANAGRRVLVVPLLLSFGGIEKGIRQRLDGLAYVMAPSGLMPDPRLADWVRQSAAQARPLAQ